MLMKLPRVSLGYFPSPIVELNQLNSYLSGPRIFMKRDDHSGLALGGNKIRKLEYLCADATAKKCDTLVTAGAVQSNHCRLTAAAAALLGLECHLLLGGHEPARSAINGNLLLDKLLGANIHWTGDNRKGEDMEKLCDELRSKGKRPYMVPYGGSNEIGALGYANAMVEIMEQLKSMKESMDAILFASSSGGTQAGLIVGAEVSGYRGRIVGVRIDKLAEPDVSFKQQVQKLVKEAGRLCHLEVHKKIEIEEGYLGGGYAVIGELEKNAIELLARKEGIFMDPVYTGRAMGGMIDMVKKGVFKKEENILFIHTGGSPALFYYNDKLI